MKDPHYRYLSWDLLNHLYEVLFYINDLDFALKVSEMLYSKVKLNDSEFINIQSCHYYANRKNMLVCEQLESIFIPLKKFHKIRNHCDIQVQGKLQKIGEKQALSVFTFFPIEPEEILSHKISKKGCFHDGKDHYKLIAELEFVVLELCGNNAELSQEIKSIFFIQWNS